LRKGHISHCEAAKIEKRYIKVGDIFRKFNFGMKIGVIGMKVFS
jgi:hypothetical protein